MNNNYSKVQNVILDSISEGVFTVDMDFRITSFNRAAEQITGISRGKAIGKPCRSVLRADVCETDCTLRRTMETTIPVMNKAVHIIDARGHKRAVAISTALLKDANGQVIGGVETFRDTSAIEQLRREIQRNYSCEDIISRNHKMQELFGLLPNIAQSNATVLIEGESGTGKELLARAVHNLSLRKDKPFIAVNCAALPDSLLESELFGYKAGAFTDAKRDKPGRFTLAEGGSIFLDEIGDVSASLQVKLLRVLQEKQYEPVGATETLKTNVRVIAATNKNLEQLIKQGLFRDDLYYRINVIKLTLLPLRERKEDIPLLIEHFISHFNQLHNKNICCVSNEVIAILLNYDFPGNVRELENIIEHCFVLCNGEMIEPMHLPGHLRAELPANTKTDATTAPGANDTADATAWSAQKLNKKDVTTIQQMEILLITDALKRNKGNKTRTARQLGIDKSTLFRKIKKYGIQL